MTCPSTSVKALTPLEKNYTYVFYKLVTIIHQLHRLVLGVKSTDITCVSSENWPFHLYSVVQFMKVPFMDTLSYLHLVVIL